MAQVELTTDGAITIKIADPVEMERLIVVLHRTNSTKVIAIREAIMALLTPAEATPEPIKVEPVAVALMIAGLEAMLAEQ